MPLVNLTISLLSALLLTFIGSRWIDSLYQMPEAPLTFPDDVESRAKFRKPLLTVLLFLCVLHFITLNLPLSIYLTLAAFFLLLITFTDFEQYVIFDRMILPFIITGIAAILHLNLPIYDRLIAALVGFGTFFLLAVLTRGGIGGGDIKLVAVLGLWLGTNRLFKIIFAACIIAGVVAVVMLLTKKIDRKSYLAYGPYFTLTTVCDLCFFSNLE